ncbi:hypothetical protein CWS02_01545 [Enterobacter sp. EA-1]|nr:hypothetical protein CWS02_01545 [Enterobacter sp. EA-1]
MEKFLSRLLDGLNTYTYVLDPLAWVDPLGWKSCRLQYMGRTPGKNSRTGRAVIQRMLEEGRIIGSGNNMRFKSSTDGKWYSVKMTDMAHLKDAVTYWNQKEAFMVQKRQK